MSMTTVVLLGSSLVVRTCYINMQDMLLRLLFTTILVPVWPQLHQERPYNHDSTASRLLSEVKHDLARLVLRWGTTLESLVLFFCSFLLSCQPMLACIALCHTLPFYFARPSSFLLFSLPRMDDWWPATYACIQYCYCSVGSLESFLRIFMLRAEQLA